MAEEGRHDSNPDQSNWPIARLHWWEGLDKGLEGEVESIRDHFVALVEVEEGAEALQQEAVVVAEADREHIGSCHR